jgi:hypothetical protein
MLLINILNTVVREAFETPRFSTVSSANSILISPSNYVALRVSFAPQPTNWAFW